MDKVARIAAAILICASSLVIEAAPKDQVCPKEPETFRGFLKQFSENKKFRLERIIFPLVVRFGELQLRLPEIEIWGEGTVEGLKYPLILTAAQLKHQGLKQEIPVSSETYVEVYHHREEADSYRRRYSFRKVTSCWFLESIHDSSL